MIKALIAYGLCLLLATVAAADNRTATPSAHPNRYSTDFTLVDAQFHTPRIALVVGNDQYRSQPLATARSDARAVAHALERKGFHVIRIDDARATNLRRALMTLQQYRDKSDIALFYFAGHALRVGDSARLLTIETSPRQITGIDIASVAHALAPRRTGQSALILIDACLSDDPSATSLQLALPRNTLLVFGSTPGGAAYDDGIAHGLFTAELLNRLSQPDRPLQQIANEIRDAVHTRSGAAQTPWIVSSLSAPLYLANTDNASIAAPPLALAPVALGAARGLLPQDGEARIELEFWKSIENSTEASDYDAYLSAYPKGRFAALAKARAERYRKTAAPAKPAEEAKPAIEPLNLDYFASTDATLRKEAANNAASAGRVGKGDPLHITGRTADGAWYRVQISSGSAFIAVNLVSKSAPQPVAAALPTPAPATPAPQSKPVRPATAAASLQSMQDCPACPALVVLPAGEFTMGDNSGDRSERPAHHVSIEHAFAIGKTEVTTAQWKECVSAGQCIFKAETSGPNPDSPVRDVSWTDAQQYLRWLSQKTKQTYRLPTEAEWEYAARAGSKSRYWWGEQIGSGNANCKNCGGAWNHAAPEVVTAFPANPFGLHGMNGSVWEWVSDCWYKSHEGASADGHSREEAGCRQHVIRGGSWRDDASYTHSASRFNYDTDVRYLTNGFRVAKTLP